MSSVFPPDGGAAFIPISEGRGRSPRLVKQQRLSKSKPMRAGKKTISKDGRTPIVMEPRLPVASLQGNYSTGLEGNMCIHAMSPEGRSAKARFLRDAWRYARALGQALACYGGFIEWKLVRNEGNENEAGNVMAYYYHSRLDYWLAVYIEADKQKTALPRPDGVIIIACKRSIKLLPRRGDAQLHYLNPALNSDHLAHVLLLLMGKKTWTDLQSYANEIYKSTRPLMIYPRAPDQAWEEKRMLIRVYLLGDYRWCSLLKPGISRAEVCCVDNHLAVALTYWGKRVTVPLQRVHPDDIANICHVNEVVLTTKDHFSPDSPVRASSHNVPSDTKQR